MSAQKPSLDAAYALASPDESRQLYADWAKDYDSGFADQRDYQLHAHIAKAFVTAGGSGPILDVGAGTGLCGEVLAELNAGPIDATDISAEMLEQAMHKDIYRSSILADLTGGLPVAANSYAGIVSSGTFTTGHVGPDALDELLKVARTDAVFAISVNAQHFAAAGFEAKFEALQASHIHGLTLQETRIYGERADGPHKDDTALIALFRKS